LSGAEMDYDFGQKRHWRRWIWNRIAEKVEDRKNAICIYLPGKNDYDRPVALERGFEGHNLIGIEKDGDVVKKLRSSGTLAIDADFLDVMTVLALRKRLGVIFGDFCGGVFPVTARKLHSAFCSPYMKKSVFAFNLMRGRDRGDECGEVWRRYINIQSCDIRMHRGCILLMNTLLLMSSSLAKQFPDQIDGTDSGLIKMSSALFNAVEPNYTSYKSGNKYFDSIVFYHPMRLDGQDQEEHEKWYSNAVNQSLKNTPLKSKEKKYLARTSRAIAAVMAHRTRRMA
jgi:hypothetical protein